MQQRSKKIKIDKIHTLHQTSREAITEGFYLEQQEEFVEAYLLYKKAARTMNSEPIEGWNHLDYLDAMLALEKAFSLVEESLTEGGPGRRESQESYERRKLESITKKIKKLASMACHLYQAAPNIQSIEFRLMAVKAILSGNGNRWTDIVITNDIQPVMLPDVLNRATDMLERAINEPASGVPMLQATLDDRILLASRCYVMIGSGYLRLADFNNAITYYMKAIDHCLALSVKEEDYFQLLYVIYNHLHMHINYDNEYAFVGFARRIFSQPALYNPSFSDLASFFLQFSNQTGVPNPLKLALWKQFFAVIQERLEAGAFTIQDEREYQAAFPDSSFRQSMCHPYYRGRFVEMRALLAGQEQRSLNVADRVEENSSSLHSKQSNENFISEMMSFSHMFSPRISRPPSLGDFCSDEPVFKK